MVLKWLGKIGTWFLLLLLVGMLFITISSKINGGPPKFFGQEIYTVLSGSMEPGIKTGSIIAVKPVANPLAVTFKPGDVITFKAADSKDMIITHRIKQVIGSGPNLKYVTKGDNNDAQDPLPVPAGNVVAQYDNFTIPYLGYVLTWIKSKVGIALMLFVPGIILIAQPMISLFKALTSEEDPKTPEGETKPESMETTPDATPSNG